MRRIAIVFILFSLSVCTTVYPVTHSIAPMLKKVMPAVVNIRVEGQLPVSISNGQNQQSQAKIKPTQKFEKFGSGVIINADKGYILTNEHVVAYAKTITVTLSDNRHFTAKLIGTDPASDIAVLKITAKNLHAIPLGDSNTLQVGDFVAAIGSPFGLNKTVTAGIISALQRNDLNIENYENFIQTDAAINPGNSGGALVNYNGKLIGINTAIVAPLPGAGNVGIGFAIPINMAYSVMQQLIKYGKIHRGSLGIFVQPLTPTLALALHSPTSQQGAVVTAVTLGSPAKTAGLRAGDVILSINNKAVQTPFDVRNILGLLRANSKILITLTRDGKKLTIHAIITDTKSQMQNLQQKQPFLSGLSLSNVNQIQSSLHGAINGGVQVLTINSQSPADIAGLLPGDIIVSANRQPVNNIAALYKAAKQDKHQLLLNVIRSSGALFVVIK